MSGGPCILQNNNSDAMLVGILIRANLNLSRNICIRIDKILPMIDAPK